LFDYANHRTFGITKNAAVTMWVGHVQGHQAHLPGFRGLNQGLQRFELNKGDVTIQNQGNRMISQGRDCTLNRMTCTQLI